MAYCTTAVLCFIVAFFQVYLMQFQIVHSDDDIRMKFCYDGTKTGYRLNATEIRNVYALSTIDCVLLCIHENCCRSANFRKMSHFDGEENCQLLHATDTGRPEDLVENKTYDHLLLRQPNRTFNSIRFPRRSASDYVISHGAPLMEAITVCFWTKTLLTSQVHFTTYAVPSNGNEFIVYMDKEELGLWKNKKGTGTQKVVISDGLWHSVCSTWTADGGRSKIYFDGNLVKEVENFFSGTTLSANGTWVLGHDQDGFGVNFDVKQMLVGEITEVNVWNEVLPKNLILEISTQCKSKFRGNVKSWNDFLEGVQGGVEIVENSSCCDIYM